MSRRWSCLCACRMTALRWSRAPLTLGLILACRRPRHSAAVAAPSLRARRSAWPSCNCGMACPRTLLHAVQWTRACVDGSTMHTPPTDAAGIKSPARFRGLWLCNAGGARIMMAPRCGRYAGWRGRRRCGRRGHRRSPRAWTERLGARRSPSRSARGSRNSLSLPSSHCPPHPHPHPPPPPVLSTPHSPTHTHHHHRFYCTQWPTGQTAHQRHCRQHAL
jgi:hypothetical protein